MDNLLDNVFTSGIESQNYSLLYLSIHFILYIENCNIYILVFKWSRKIVIINRNPIQKIFIKHREKIRGIKLKIHFLKIILSIFIFFMEFHIICSLLL